MAKEELGKKIKKYIALIIVIIAAILIALWLWLSGFIEKATMHTPYE